MLPLIRMTWTVNRRMLAWLSPLYGLYLYLIVAAAADGDPARMLGIASSSAWLLMAIVVFQGLGAPTEAFVLALPVTRSQVVRATYATGLAALALGLLVPILACCAAHALTGHVPLPGREVLAILGLETLAYASVLFCFLPFAYRFGLSRGLAGFTGCLIVLAAVALALKGWTGVRAGLLALAGRALDQPPFALALAAGVVTLGLLSLGVAIRSYRPR